MKKFLFLMLLLGVLAIPVFLYIPIDTIPKSVDVKQLIRKFRPIQNDDEEKKLYDMVSKIPASDIYKNRDIYKKLTQLNPGSKLYKQKLAYYQGLIDRSEIEKNSKRINRNNELIDSLISQGAISVDKQFFKIYVDTGVWNAMDYPTKSKFCMAVNNIYTGYFIVDKYSGKTLANTNRLGEISITQ